MAITLFTCNCLTLWFFVNCNRLLELSSSQMNSPGFLCLVPMATFLPRADILVLWLPILD